MENNLPMQTPDQGMMPAPEAPLPAQPAQTQPAAPVETHMAAPATEDVTPYAASTDTTPLVTPEQQAAEATDRLIAVCSYLSILFIIPLLFRQGSKECQFHAKQGMGLFFVWLGIHIFGIMVRIVPLGIFKSLAIAILSLNGLALFAFIALGIYNVFNGRMQPLPLIGPFVVDKFLDKKFTLNQ